MTPSLAAEPKVEEYPVVFGPKNDLFGIMRLPAGPVTTACIVFHQGGGFPATGNGDTWVTFGRRWVDQGYATIRFDYHGVGESDGECSLPDLTCVGDDNIAFAIDMAESRFGLTRFIIIASCFSGSGAIVAAQQHDSVVGIVFLAAPMVTIGTSSEIEDQIPTRIAQWMTLDRASVSGRRIPSLFIYGKADGTGTSGGYNVQLAGVRTSVNDDGCTISVVPLEGKVRGMAQLETQENIFNAITNWCNTLSVSSETDRNRSPDCEQRGGLGQYDDTSKFGMPK